MNLQATVTIQYAELQTLITARAKAEAETAEVRKELAEARLASPDGKVAEMAAFSRECLTLARFAVAHCPPETTVGWPFDVLRRVCDGIEKLPDASTMDRDLAIDLRMFATECESFERVRQAVKPGVVASKVERAPGGPVGYSTTTFSGEGQ